MIQNKKQITFLKKDNNDIAHWFLNYDLQYNATQNKC